MKRDPPTLAGDTAVTTCSTVGNVMSLLLLAAILLGVDDGKVLSAVPASLAAPLTQTMGSLGIPGSWYEQHCFRKSGVQLWGDVYGQGCHISALHTPRMLLPAMRLRGGKLLAGAEEESARMSSPSAAKRKKPEKGRPKNPNLFSERKAGLSRGGDISKLPESVQQKILKKRTMRAKPARDPEGKESRAEKTELRRKRKEKVSQCHFI